MGMRCHTAAIMAALISLTLPVAAQPGALTTKQSNALAAYDQALANFKSILAERRRQIDARQELPNLPGQPVYLARVEVISTYKDLTDALPSRIGRPNKFKIPPAYFDADISAQTRSAFVARENRFTLFANAALRVRIML